MQVRNSQKKNMRLELLKKAKGRTLDYNTYKEKDSRIPEKLAH